jgi:hypothetical protein
MNSNPHRTMNIDGSLELKARELIRTGALPARLPDRMWGGPGSGSPCPVCGRPVRDDEIGLEIELGSDGTGASAQHFHVPCFTALKAELRKLEHGEARGGGAIADAGAVAGSAARPHGFEAKEPRVAVHEEQRQNSGRCMP